MDVAPITSDRNDLSGVHSEASRYDGSRTPADKQLLIWQLFEREQRTEGEIAEILGMNPYTVKAVIARKDTLIADARMLLKANALEFAHNLIEAAPEAAKRGKLEGIAAVLDRLGVTEPPKSQNSTSVAVQVNLHGGPEPLSLANTEAKSETLVEQAHSGVSLIMEPMSTAQPVVDAGVIETVAPTPVARKTPAKKGKAKA